MTAFLYEITFSDFRVERVVIYAPSRRAADAVAEKWAQGHGVEVVAPVEEEDEAG